MTENVVHDYGWGATPDRHTRNSLAPKILEILNNLGVRPVLDLGSGNGALCAQLAAAGFESVGVEYDAKGVEMAKREYPSLHFYQLGVQDDPMELAKHEKPFEAVVSTEVIEHLFSPHLLPRFAAETLQAGGFIVISTPYHGYLKNLALSLLGAWDKHHTAMWHGGILSSGAGGLFRISSSKTVSRFKAFTGSEDSPFCGKA
ncbi:MAG: class I SAM-dependent methyltransferase [Synechococcaceae cyanobacterium]|jgi:2-polyprenyl-3-methyl-5-hydroxy-6-metoxy-1,4-benzoquinol methylase